MWFTKVLWEGKRLPIAERVLPTGNWRGKVGTIAWPWWISWPATSLALRVCHTRTLQPRREACFSESSNVHAVVSALKQLNRNEEAIHTILYNTNNNQNLLIAYYVSSPACSQFFADMIIYHYKSFTCVFFLICILQIIKVRMKFLEIKQFSRRF